MPSVAGVVSVALRACTMRPDAAIAVSELMDVRGGRAEPAHTALGYTIIVTGERYKRKRSRLRSRGAWRVRSFLRCACSVLSFLRSWPLLLRTKG